MHIIHVTQGIVLGKRGVGEASVALSLLTAEHGLLRAAARSARAEKSKLRYGLEPLTVGRFSLVRGRREWLLTGVEGASRARVAVAGMERRRAAGRITRLLLRLIHGEEPVGPLYRTVEEGFGFLADAPGEREAQAIECVLVLRILSHLGYLPEHPELAPFVGDVFFSLQLADEAARSRTLLVRAINESLAASGL